MVCSESVPRISERVRLNPACDESDESWPLYRGLSFFLPQWSAIGIEGSDAVFSLTKKKTGDTRSDIFGWRLWRSRRDMLCSLAVDLMTGYSPHLQSDEVLRRRAMFRSSASFGAYILR